MRGSIMPEPFAMPPTRNDADLGGDLDGVFLRKRIGRHDRARRGGAAVGGQRGDGLRNAGADRCPS